MIRTMIWGLLLSVACVIPAHAQGKKVVTINPDGSVTVTDPQGGEARQLPPPKINPRRQPPFIDALPPEEQEKIRKTVKPSPPQEPQQPRKQAAPEKPLREKTVTPEKPQPKKPVTEQTKKPSTPKPKKTTVYKPVTPEPEPVEMPPAKPGQEPDMTRGEPAAPDSIGRVDPKVQPRPIRVRGELTAEDAKRIAFDVGPPASAVDAYPADYNGRKVFQVIFRTEDGERYVLVDRKTGEIVKD